MNIFRAFRPSETIKPSLLSWFATEQGKKASNVAAAFASAGCLMSYLLPHYLLLSKTQSVLQMYRDGDPVELPALVHQRARQVLEETSLSKKEKRMVSFFTAFGFDVIHAGASKLRNGAIVGIPISFNYKSTSDIHQNQLALLDNPEFSWKSRTGQRILTTLLMSIRAQQFAIAREIYYTSTHYVYLNGMAASMCFISAYSAGHYINRKLDLFKRPLRQRLGLYAILGSLAAILFILAKDMITTSTEAYVDEKAADMGKDYILGGLEYYEYMIERNKALRDAMGQNGDKYYTAGGNVKEWVRVSQVPLTARFDYIKRRLEECEITEPHVAPLKPKKSGLNGGKPPIPPSLDTLAPKDLMEEKKLDPKKIKLVT